MTCALIMITASLYLNPCEISKMKGDTNKKCYISFIRSDSWAYSPVSCEEIYKIFQKAK